LRTACFLLYKNSLISVSSIKRPSQNYVSDIIAKTEIDRRAEDSTFEIGYSFTEQHFRRNGISKALKKELLNQKKSRNGTIFLTTAIKRSQNFLEENSF